MLLEFKNQVFAFKLLFRSSALAVWFFITSFREAYLASSQTVERSVESLRIKPNVSFKFDLFSAVCPPQIGEEKQSGTPGLALKYGVTK